MTEQTPLWETKIKEMGFSKVTTDDLIDFIYGHADDARLTEEEYIAQLFESEAEMAIADAPEEDTFGFTVEQAVIVASTIFAGAN